MVGITGRYITSGEQLFVSYVDDILKNRNDRREWLKDQFWFDCKCERFENSEEITEVDIHRERNLNLYQLESKLNQPANWNTRRGAQMITYEQKLNEFDANRNFLR